MTESPTAGDSPAEDVDAPLDRMLSLSEVCAAEGVTRWTIRRRVKDGKFPPGYELENGGIGWPESVIRARRESLPRRTYGAELPPEPSDDRAPEPQAAA